MHQKLRTEVHFRSSAFNTSDARDYFINPGCYGDDLCHWLMKQLREMGIVTAVEPRQEDFGWYFTFGVKNTEHCLVVSYEPGASANGGIWHGWLERHVGFLASLVGGRNRGIMPAAGRAIHDILIGSELIHDVTWHYAHDPADQKGVPYWE